MPWQKNVCNLRDVRHTGLAGLLDPIQRLVVMYGKRSVCLDLVQIRESD